MIHRFIEFIKSAPFLFAIVTILAYGLLLPFTGFYWDDWPFAWIANFLGPKEFFAAFATIRPFLAPIFFITTSLVPSVPIYWQIFALIIRFISGLSFWFMLNQIFPGFKRQVLIVSLLFIVFPGYSQHWVAFTHINQEWIPFIFYILSFGFTAYALRHPNKFKSHTIYALLLLIVGLLPTEYFASIEPLRFLFIWVIVLKTGSTFRKRFVHAFKIWTPYLLVWLTNAAWLVYFFSVKSYGSYDLNIIKKPLSITQLFLLISDTIWNVGFYIWGQVLVLASKSITAPSTLLTLILIGIALIGFIPYFLRFEPDMQEPRKFMVPALLIGFAGVLLGRSPSLTAGLPLKLQSSYDRIMISMMIGGSLFVFGIVELLIKKSHAKIIIYSLLIACGIGQQFFNANIFRRDWARQQDIYWQLAWRIPAMKSGTLLITDELFIDYETGASLTAPINWMYKPDYERSDPVPYAIIFSNIRLGQSLPTLQKGNNINVGLRSVSFRGSTSKVIVIYMPQNGCLRVLDPERGDQTTYEWQTRFLVDAIPLSDPANIVLDSDQTVKLPFFSEPAHAWCYYYTKAELAYQRKNWKQVIAHIDEAVSLGYSPQDPFEWLAYIEAQALIGNINTSRELSSMIFTTDSNTRKGLCIIWKRVKEDIVVPTDVDKIEQALLEFECT